MRSSDQSSRVFFRSEVQCLVRSRVSFVEALFEHSSVVESSRRWRRGCTGDWNWSYCHEMMEWGWRTLVFDEKITFVNVAPARMSRGLCWQPTDGEDMGWGQWRQEQNRHKKLHDYDLLVRVSDSDTKSDWEAKREKKVHRLDEDDLTMRR